MTTTDTMDTLATVEQSIRCIEAGAEDCVPKPFNPVVLRARITASLEKKRLRDQEQAYLAQLQVERTKSDRLLLNVLPKAIAARLRATCPGLTVIVPPLFSKRNWPSPILPLASARSSTAPGSPMPASRPGRSSKKPSRRPCKKRKTCVRRSAIDCAPAICIEYI